MNKQVRKGDMQIDPGHRKTQNANQASFQRQFGYREANICQELQYAKYCTVDSAGLGNSFQAHGSCFVLSFGFDHLEQRCPTQLSAMMEMLYVCMVQRGNL